VRKSQAARRIPCASLLLGALAAVIYSFPALAEALQYDRSAVLRGELWRIVTCHWTHWSLDHLLWDLAVFVGLGAACEQMDRCRYLVGLAAATILIPLSVVIFLPSLETYRGLSGLDSTLFALLVVLNLDKRLSLGVGFFVAFLLKTAYELATGGTVFVSSPTDIVSVPLAHAVGAAVGILMVSRFVSPTGPPDTLQALCANLRDTRGGPSCCSSISESSPVTS
jgi:rhomboid family GlyGly-CTERM serine protease